MIVVIAGGMCLEEFILTALQEIGSTDLLILKHGVVPEVDFSEELSGQTRVFSELCLLSQNLDCTLIAACDTNVYGLKHKSAAVIDRGKLLDVKDMIYAESEGFDNGTDNMVSFSNNTIFGVLVHNDILYPEVARTLCLFGAEVLVDLSSADSEIHELLARAGSAANGLYSIYSSPSAYAVIDTQGKVERYGTENYVRLELENSQDPTLVNALSKNRAN